MVADKILVYLGFSVENGEPPHWAASLVRSLPADSPYIFFFSGGVLTPQCVELLQSRAGAVSAQQLAMKLVHGSVSRLVPHITSPKIEQIYKSTQDAPLSTEYSVLLDLLVLSRSDVYVVDCDVLTRGRLGMEAAYAHGIVRTVGVSDTPVLDRWYQYHLDVILKSHSLFSYLELLRHDILRIRSSRPANAPEKPQE